MNSCLNKRKIRAIVPIIETCYGYDSNINEKRWQSYPTIMKETVVSNHDSSSSIGKSRKSIHNFRDKNGKNQSKAIFYEFGVNTTVINEHVSKIILLSDFKSMADID